MKKDEKGFRDIIVGSLTKTTGQVRKRIEPWLDPPDRTIVGSKGSNHDIPKGYNCFPLENHDCASFV